MGTRIALASLAVALAATPAFALMEPSGILETSNGLATTPRA